MEQSDFNVDPESERIRLRAKTKTQIKKWSASLETRTPARFKQI